MARLAYFKAGRQLVEGLLPPGKVLDCLADKIGPVDFKWFEEALRLPANARVNGVSMAAGLATDEIWVRVECPDFPEVHPGCVLCEVCPTYRREGDTGVFDGWNWGKGFTRLDGAPQPANATSITYLESRDFVEDAERVQKKFEEKVGPTLKVNFREFI